MCPVSDPGSATKLIEIIYNNNCEDKIIKTLMDGVLGGGI
jgi:hypothetical protein